MADRVLFTSWGQVVRGREERALEVFNEVLGFYGRLQQEGRIETFDAVLLEPSSGINGYLDIRGSADQIAALREDEAYRRIIIDSALVVDDLKIMEGFADQGVARELGLYQERISHVPQTA
ncbi:MAG: hypothetical protein QOH46_1813 [Solirubrobacteraceae bacterium]|jgi:hypothetical protein|nr:hypothetical protein [Solirubrobacteraceae bacterium]